jgi:hypothetical protein
VTSCQFFYGLATGAVLGIVGTLGFLYWVLKGIASEDRRQGGTL